MQMDVARTASGCGVSVCMYVCTYVCSSGSVSMHGAGSGGAGWIWLGKVPT